LGNLHCAPQAVFAAIVYVVKELHSARPSAHIVLHTLLPRNDVYQSGNYSLGILWEHIQWINTQLLGMDSTSQQRQMPYLHVVDHGGDLFLLNATTLNADLMKDGLHPSEKGYQKWAPLLAQDIQSIMKLIPRRM
jgi:lysophospholipase L1-like esterase